ncbi:MAG: amidophosphoribosyltransferase [Synechococcales cyanobacterium C42_A2020_086]|jgi:amidophosphoribosyltransferase|nr:amidophosphoribosyltransferase [Synechococcales cyanobacterium M58_A2018_015]MBF2075062.1 amidophosphoribosyltransferase [Synechococcales cyanobacterium C42_A2020_086]
MCGIAGLIYHSPALYSSLGSTLLALIQPLESRGPDSCGIALYSDQITAGQVKLLLHGTEATPWQQVHPWLEQAVRIVQRRDVPQGLQLTVDLSHSTFDPVRFKQELHQQFPSLHVVSIGQSLEIYKATGSVESLSRKYGLSSFSGSHGIGHTRMATESVVDTHHSHPFTSSYDLSLVHNGQVSNYYKLRFQLERMGAVFETQNDSEALAHYIHYQLLQGKSLEAALHQLLQDVDGTYTFLVATGDKVALVRDKFAAKPAVIYETENQVAIVSEYRALLTLPGFDPAATIREPGAGEVNIWSVTPSTMPTRTLVSQ